jgi:hypothetical protein
MTAININHKTATISTEEDKALNLQINGGIKIGDGSYLEEDGEYKKYEAQEQYKGVIRYNSDNDCLQVCDGSTWRNINGQYKQTSDIIWSLLF